MKKPILISSILSVVIILVLFLTWNNKIKPSLTSATSLREDEITEAKLPKGKSIIEEPLGHVDKPIVITPVSGNNPKNKENNNYTIPETKTEKLQKKFKSLLVFHVDDTMEVNKAKLAVLVLAKDESMEKVKMEILEESGDQNDKMKTDTTMDFGSKMKARLIPFSGSKTDFEIEPLGDDEQSFKADRKKIIWQWKITPLVPGEHELKLSIQIIEKDGEAVSLPARNIPVTIFAKQEGIMSKLGDFFATQYQWIVTAIMIPLIIAIVNSRVKNRAHKHQQNQADQKT